MCSNCSYDPETGYLSCEDDMDPAELDNRADDESQDESIDQLAQEEQLTACDVCMERPASILATRQVIDLHVSYDFPPIPVRHFDYSAIDRNTFDVDFVDGRYVTSCAQGHGATENEAINDLFDRMEEQG